MSSRADLSLNIIRLSNVFDDPIIILTPLTLFTLGDASEMCGEQLLVIENYSRSAH